MAPDGLQYRLPREISLRVSSFGLLTSEDDPISRKPRAINSASEDLADKDKQMVNENKADKMLMKP